jgi:sugar phosphate isomerase/epimerase
MRLDEALDAYSRIGFTRFEVFTSWVKSAFDIDRDPAEYVERGRRYRMTFASMHLPPVGDDLAGSLDAAVRAARFAEAVGAGVVLFKAASRPNYIRAAGPFLDAIDSVGVTPVLQNHAGSPITSLEDFREVIDGIGDPRMRSLLEVGHFHAVGVDWREAADALGDGIALVHVKDQIQAQSVPFGTGQIDLPALLAHMRSVGYAGDYVVEMEVQDRHNTLRYLSDARRYILERCL